MKWIALCCALFCAGSASAYTVEQSSGLGCRVLGDNAIYGDPTSRYGHAVLGDAIEWGALEFPVACDDGGGQIKIVLPDELVFEDIAPRPADMLDDAFGEVITVESHRDLGARLVIWGFEGSPELSSADDLEPVRLGVTDFIGRRNRWLAPIGAADLDGDGEIEIAYVDRPHLAKTLRVVSIQGDRLVEEAAVSGLTNHRIGEDYISGGVRDCGDGPEMVVASANWSQLLAVTYDGDFQARQIGTDTTPAGFAAAMACS